MTLKEFLTMANKDDTPLTMVDYYKLWQPLSSPQFWGRGMYGAVKQDVGAYNKENLDKTS
jgi:hypothetical protein